MRTAANIGGMGRAKPTQNTDSTGSSARVRTAPLRRPRQSSAPPAALASDAVAGYLNALAAGHAAAALAYSANPVKPGPFLTDEVLAALSDRDRHFGLAAGNFRGLFVFFAAFRLVQAAVVTVYFLGRDETARRGRTVSARRGANLRDRSCGALAGG